MVQISDLTVGRLEMPFTKMRRIGRRGLAGKVKTC